MSEKLLHEVKSPLTVRQLATLLLQLPDEYQDTNCVLGYEDWGFDVVFPVEEGIQSVVYLKDTEQVVLMTYDPEV